MLFHNWQAVLTGDQTEIRLVTISNILIGNLYNVQAYDQPRIFYQQRDDGDIAILTHEDIEHLNDFAERAGYPRNNKKQIKYGAEIWGYAEARIRVIDSRQQLIQDMSKQDALKEGYDTLAGFRKSWDNLHVKRDRWSQNPLVYVVSFALVE